MRTALAFPENTLASGIRDGLPIALGYLPAAVTFGSWLKPQAYRWGKP